MNIPREEYIMTNRKDDDIIPKVIRAVDWKWMLGICGGMLVWAVTQWVNYAGLIKGVEGMEKSFTALTVEVKQISEQLTNLKIADLKHDGEIARLKDQVSDIQAWKQSQQNGKSK